MTQIYPKDAASRSLDAGASVAGTTLFGGGARLSFVLFVLLKPFYIFSSGSFQAGDLCLAIAFLCLLADRGRFFLIEKRDFLFIAFFFCAVIINFAYFLAYGDALLMRTGLYYLFALMSILLFRDLCADDRLLSAVRIALTADLVIQLAVFLAGAGRWYAGSSRYMGTFNDPNQFGVFIFFSFLMMKLIYKRLGSKYRVYEDVLALFLMAQSASTGMMLGFGSYYVFLYANMLFGKKAKKEGIAGIVLVSALLVGIGVLAAINWESIIALTQDSYAARRLISKVEQLLGGGGGDSSIGNFLEDRGLTKIIYYPQYLIYGSGEGAYSRFASIHSNLELHSTLLGPFFYYGAIPFAILLAWVCKNVKGSLRSGTWVCLLPMLLECLTLANQRQPLFWMVIVLAAYINQQCNAVARGEQQPDSGALEDET